jgi:glycosyltransferase involved in cell wall biosynthesis
MGEQMKERIHNSNSQSLFSKCVVVIPTHKSELFDFELDSLHNTLEVLSHWDVVIAVPSDLDVGKLKEYLIESKNEFQILRQPEGFLGTIEKYNAMALTAEFYKQFDDYDYMLIVHLDAYVLRDELLLWMNQGFDYIGAPLFLPRKSKSSNLWRGMAPQGGNGGFSLRKIKPMQRILESDNAIKWNFNLFFRACTFLVVNKEWKYLKVFIRCCLELLQDPRKFREKHEIYEDVMISIFYSLRDRTFKVAPATLAIGFGLEVNGPEIFSKHLSLTSPFGIHGINKYFSLKQFQLIVENRSLRQRSLTFGKACVSAPEDYFPKISVVTIVKNLYENQRMGFFKQCCSSVQQQDYPNLEYIVIDGASTDGSLAELQEMAESNFFTLYSQPDDGVWDAMHTGMRKCSGKYINFMNSDDYFLDKSALSKMIKKMPDKRWVFSGALIEKLDGSTYSFPTSVEGVFHCMGIVHQATLVEVELLRTISPFTSNHVTRENHMMMSLLASGFEPGAIPEELVMYREGGFSTFHYGGENLERTKRDFGSYFFDLFGQYWGLSKEDCYQFFGWQCFTNLGIKESFKLLNKISRKSLKKEFLKRLYQHASSKYSIRAMVTEVVRVLVSRVSFRLRRD